jgi:hypothetical protein
MKCTKCGFEGNPNLEETGPHTKATCRKCGAYIKMMSKQEIEMQIKNLPKPTILCKDIEKVRQAILEEMNCFENINPLVSHFPTIVAALSELLRIKRLTF